MALLYEAQARIALAAGELPDALKALGALRDLLEHAEAPALLSAYEALREESTRRMRGSDPAAAAEEQTLAEVTALDPKTLRATKPLGAEVTATHEQEHESLGDTQFSAQVSPSGSSRATSTTLGKQLSQTRALFGDAVDRQQRAQLALTLLLEDSGCRGGHLLLFDVGGVVAAASSHLPSPDEELLTWAYRFLELEAGFAKDAMVSTSEHVVVSTPPPAPCGENDVPLMPLILSDLADGHSMFVGLALLEPGDGPVRYPRGEIVRVLSRLLLDAGDTMPFVLDG
jgi:hypothetical protein